MERVPGGSLSQLIKKEWIKKPKENNEPLIKCYTQQILRGLDYLVGILYRRLSSKETKVFLYVRSSSSCFGCEIKLYHKHDLFHYLPDSCTVARRYY